MRIALFVFSLLLGSTVLLGADESTDPTSPAVTERLQFCSTWNRQNWRARQVRTGREDVKTILLVEPAQSRIAQIDGNGILLALWPSLSSRWDLLAVAPIQSACKSTTQVSPAQTVVAIVRAMAMVIK